MYKVTNKMKDMRKFHDNKSGKDIYVEPGKSVQVDNPPASGDVWKVEEVKKVKGEM